VSSLYREPDRPLEVVWGALELHDVFKIYRSGPAESVALRGLDLRIERGEIVAVFGQSGSGKSTMLRLAAGLEQPSAGEVRSLGLSLGRLDDGELAEYRAHSAAVVFQSRNLWPELTARENVELVLRLAGKRDGADEALAAFGLTPASGRLAAVLSGGEQQRVAIAAAAAREAPLVLADEPTAELDEENEWRVLTALARLRDDHGSAVVVVTHSPRVADLADRVIEIRDGTVRVGDEAR
jgi:putative ABC transport system ATP-binding protein